MALEDDYSGHKGFDPAFLGAGKADGRVFLPDLSPALAKQATTLSASPKETVLRYRNYSVVMHRIRRFAIYSAANVDFKGRFELARPKDRWRFDPRIPAEMQVGESFYTGNAFDRGHLTRREDQEFGPTPQEAINAAADTCHWTNCMPQHARFNERRELWQGLEHHILEEAVDKDHFRAQVITGPVFDAADPVRRFMSERRLRLPVALAPHTGLELGHQLGNISGGLPFSVAFTASGEVAQRKLGSVDDSLLKTWVSTVR